MNWRCFFGHVWKWTGTWGLFDYETCQRCGAKRVA